MAVAVLDLVEDHRGLVFDWNLTFAADLQASPHADRLGFTLAHVDGTRMDARFLGTPPEEILLLRTPESNRTYSGGEQVTYPGRPYVCARFAARPIAGIFVVMVAHRGEVPCPESAGGVGVRFGEERWARPFGAAVPEGFVPGEAGILSFDPTGRRRKD